MARKLDITVPRGAAAPLCDALRGRDGVLSVSVLHGASVTPDGDVVSVLLTNRALAPTLERLTERGIGVDAGTLITTSEPLGLLSASHADEVARDTNDAAWEEVDSVLRNEAGANANLLAMMGLGGAIATVGIATGALHFVLAAMIIAPGLEPIVRVALGLVARARTWRQGLSAFAGGYLALITGAVLASLFVRASGRSVIGGGSTQVDSMALVSLWTSFDAPGIAVSLVAALAAAVLIAANRSELTIGAMIGLALIPAACLVPMGLIDGNAPVALRALGRFMLDVGLVAGASLAVMAWKRARVQRRSMIGAPRLGAAQSTGA